MGVEGERTAPLDLAYLDTETIGFHGVAALIQYAINGGPVQLHEVFERPTQDTLKLIEYLCTCRVVGFNLTFDWFHICKLYTILLLTNKEDWDLPPDPYEMAAVEMEARDGPCLKPAGAVDLFLYAKKGPYQSLMDRDDIRLKKVPAILAHDLANELETRVKLPDVYFARRKDKYAPKWKVRPEEDGFCDIVLSFEPSSALKALCADLFKDEVIKFDDIAPKCDKAVEFGYAPFAKAVAPNGKGKDTWKGAWPDLAYKHNAHWTFNTEARKYGEQDVILVRRLFEAWTPPLDDDDSILACCVAAARWKGYALDLNKLRRLKSKAEEESKIAPKDAGRSRAWLMEVLSDTEKAVINDTTNKVELEKIAKLDRIDCTACDDDTRAKCTVCEGMGQVHTHTYEAGWRAGQILKARKAAYDVNIYEKLLLAGRFHASFKIIGALSGRMAGADDLNAQGIKATDEVRSCFLLAFDGETLTGGDFASFEVVLAEAVYKDEALHKDLTEAVKCANCDGTGKIGEEDCKPCEGKGKYVRKLHGLFGQQVFTDMTYEDILASAGTADDVYNNAKRAVFAMMYGGQGNTLASRLGVPIDTAEEAYQRFIEKYKGVGKARKKVFEMFCSMRQENGIGTPIVWREPADYIMSIFGFKRYFTLENSICRELFGLAEKPPPSWARHKVKVVRRDREQTAGGATRSAVFACAFSIQAQNMRSGANHEIQSPGATLTKKLQRRIWDLQPAGIGPWVVRPMNVHDEINCACNNRETIKKILELKSEFVTEYRAKVPLLKIAWKETMNDWSGKHS
jgi:hypothetical protein